MQCVFFRLDHVPAETVTCGDKTKQMQLPGDFSSDAQFFVFTGVLSFLATMGILVVYVFFSDMYFAESKMAPMIVSSSKIQAHHMTWNLMAYLKIQFNDGQSLKCRGIILDFQVHMPLNSWIQDSKASSP